MLLIGLTGGIGSGKSTVLNLFKQKGVPCYIADLEAKKLMNSSPEIKKDIIDFFGENAYLNDTLNSEYLAELVFKDASKLKKLNSIVHPRVHSDFKAFVSNVTSNYVIYESAILFENNKQSEFDYVITVTAPIEDRIQRVVQRDNVSSADVRLRINNQMDEAIKISQSDFVINNADSITSLQKEVDILHDKFLFLRK